MLDKYDIREMILSGKDITKVDYSHITDMSYMFAGLKYLKDIPHLDTSNVVNMEGMFDGCFKFNGDISYWDVSNVENMHGMFYQCYKFNQNLNDWNVSKAKNTSHMFHRCTSFNQPLNKWDVSNVENMSGMFLFCSNFNQCINDWDVSNVENMAHMFGLALTFNQSLDKWDVSNVKNAIVMFYIPEEIEIELRLIFEKNHNNAKLSLEDKKILKKYGFSDPLPSSIGFLNQDLKAWRLLNTTRVRNMFNDGDKFLDHFGVSKSINLLCSYDSLDDFSRQALLSNGRALVPSEVSRLINKHLISK